ncbi:MAG: ABC transporter permease, partial [Spirochaetes bacterium]|nr:ABC transporter permease [Spirochaetota bacterium]
MQSENQSVRSNFLVKLRSIINFQQWGIISVLIVLVIILGISSPVFLSPRNIRNILQQISTFGILSMGMTVLMISGGIDLSVGSSISVAAVIVGKWLKAGYPVGIGIVLGLLIGSFIGFLNGMLASHTRAHPFILTLG